MTSQPSTASPEIQLLDLEKRFREVRAVDGVSLEIGTGEFFSLLGPSGCGKTTTLRMIGGFELPTDRHDPPARARRHERAARQAAGQHGLPELRAVPASRRRRQRGVRAQAPEGRQGRDDPSRRRGARAGPPDRLREAQAEPAVRRPAAAGGARPRAGEPAQRAAARRAARRARPQAPPPAPGRAQAHPDRGRDHVRVRDPRPGRGADDERPDRGHARRQGRAAGHARGALRAAGDAVRGRLHRLDEPSAGPGRRAAAGSGSTSGESRAVAHDGLAAGTEIEISIRPEAISLVPAAAEGAIGATVEQAAYLGSTISYRRSNDGRARPDRP